jgi:hypothetical protein
VEETPSIILVLLDQRVHAQILRTRQGIRGDESACIVLRTVDTVRVGGQSPDTRVSHGVQRQSFLRSSHRDTPETLNYGMSGKSLSVISAATLYSPLS